MKLINVKTVVLHEIFTNINQIETLTPFPNDALLLKGNVATTVKKHTQ